MGVVNEFWSVGIITWVGRHRHRIKLTKKINLKTGDFPRQLISMRGDII